MKIIYHENPLRTVVELDEHDRQIFWLKIKLEEQENLLFNVHFNLTRDQSFRGDNIDLDAAKRSANPDYYMAEKDGEKTPLDKRVDRLFKTYVEELVGWHSGDCTCVVCSCMKCHAEGLLGIDTLKPFPGKQVLAKVDSAFCSYEDGKKQTRSLSEALVHLRDRKIPRQKPDSWNKTSQEEYEKHIPRWEKEQALAYEYLKNYAKEHFGYSI
jgi:hypothetical protein